MLTQFSLAFIFCIINNSYQKMSDEPIQKCENCLKQFPQSKMATHFGYCRRNIKRCQQCGQLYDINNKQQHQEQFHKKMLCNFCKKEYSPIQLQIHQKACPKRTKYCEYCELNVPNNQYDVHLRACQARTKQCDKCMKPVSNKQYFIHIAVCQGSKKQISSSSDNRGINSNKSYQQYLKNNKRVQENYPDQEIMKPEYSADFQQMKKPIKAGEDQQKNKYKKQAGQRHKIKNIESSNSYKYSKSTSNNNVGSNYIKNAHEIKQPNNYMRQQRHEQKAQNTQAINLPQKPQIKRIQDIPTHGVKRPIQQYKKYQQRQDKPSKNSIFQKKEHIPFFDPRQYGGYEQNEGIYQQMLQQSYSQKKRAKLLQFDESEQIQKAIMQSIEQKQNKTIPKQFQTQQLMRSSFTRDFDIEKQKAIYQDLQRKAKNRKR